MMNVLKRTSLYNPRSSHSALGGNERTQGSPLLPRALHGCPPPADPSGLLIPDVPAHPLEFTCGRIGLNRQPEESVPLRHGITVLDETWTVFRRYSRFREMHKTLKLKHAELATLEFPPKKLFGNKDERVIAERRSQLERYLRDFFSVMLQSATSPLHIDKVGLTLSKHTVCEFSPFFKKGVFDYSSHGTG
uniref:Kinesin family member 16B n=1 Tax=Bos indicus x Bos taurus TaxID=30522 RepID=A0A4W2CCU7_BOBOX